MSKQKITRHIKQLEKQLFLLNYLIDHGASTYKTLMANRPNRVKLRRVLVKLHRSNYVDIHQETLTTLSGIVLATYQTYEVKNYPRALKAIKQWETQVEEFKGMISE